MASESITDKTSSNVPVKIRKRSVSDRLLRPTAANIASTREILEKKSAEPVRINLEKIRPVSDHLLLPTASLLHGQRKRLEDLETIDAEDDIWWTSRVTPKSIAIERAPNPYEHIVSKLSEPTFAVVMHSAERKFDDQSPMPPAENIQPIGMDSRLLSPTFSSLRMMYYYNPSISELSISDTKRDDESQLRSISSSRYQAVVSRLHESTAATKAHTYKSKEDLLIEEEVRREAEYEERKGSIKVVTETPIRLLLPTVAYEHSIYRPASPSPSSSTAQQRDWKPINHAQGKELLGLPLEKYFHYTEEKVSETPSHLLLPTASYELSCYKQRAPPPPSINGSIKTKPPAPPSDHLLHPTEAMLNSIATRKAVAEQHTNATSENQPRSRPSRSNPNPVSDALLRPTAAMENGRYRRASEAETSQGRKKIRAKKASSIDGSRMMVPVSLLRTTAAMENGKYHHDQRSVSPKPVPKLSAAHHLLKPTAAMERGKYIPPAERLSIEEKVDEKNRAHVPVSPISKEEKKKKFTPKQ